MHALTCLSSSVLSISMSSSLSSVSHSNFFFFELSSKPARKEEKIEAHRPRGEIIFWAQVTHPRNLPRIALEEQTYRRCHCHRLDGRGRSSIVGIRRNPATSHFFYAGRRLDTCTDRQLTWAITLHAYNIIRNYVGVGPEQTLEVWLLSINHTIIVVIPALERATITLWWC